MKRFIAGFVAVLMLCTTMVFADDSAVLISENGGETAVEEVEAVTPEAVEITPFTDVAGHWAEENIKAAQTYGIINGDGDGKFRPDDSISRAEFLKMLTVSLFGPVPEQLGDTTHWASRYNVAAQALMYEPLKDAESAVNGTNAGVFTSAEDYDKPIQRWEMAFMISETLVNNIAPVNSSDYSAIEEIKDTYPAKIEDSITICAGLGIFNGDENGKLNMNDGGTRAEAVTLIIRVADGAVKLSEDYDAKQLAELEKTMKTYEEIPEGHPVVTVEMENGKKFKIELYPEYAPQTVANFVALVESGFYDGVGFHRVIEGFMAQGGDPNGDGTGNAENTIVGEFAANGFTKNALKHERGVVSMARTNYNNSASCQFFICYDKAESLDDAYAAFGKVIEGMEVVDEFLEVEMTENAMGEKATPVEPIVMKKVTVEK